MGSGTGPIGFGGRIDDRFSRDVPTAARAEAGLRRLLPGLAGVRVERAWGGPIDVSADHLPFFRTKPGTRIHYGAGYSGHGVGPAWLGGRILASLALGAGRRVDAPAARDPLRAAPAAGAVPPGRRRPRPLGDHGLRGGRGGGTPPAARCESGGRAPAAARDGARHALDASGTWCGGWFALRFVCEYLRHLRRREPGRPALLRLVRHPARGRLLRVRRDQPGGPALLWRMRSAARGAGRRDTVIRSGARRAGGCDRTARGIGAVRGPRWVHDPVRDPRRGGSARAPLSAISIRAGD